LADLEKYAGEVETFEQLLIERDNLRNSLVDACQSRSSLRSKCAKQLTESLATDLDPDILRIEIVARPAADRQEFDGWLQQYFDPVFSKYKSNRRMALLESGLSPGELRGILLDPDEPDASKLRNNKQRAEDGRITIDDCDNVVSSCRGLRRVLLDDSDKLSSDFLDSLPKSLGSGVLTFPHSGAGRGLSIDAVLRLDEIVLDDLPEVLLNDRPTETQSAARPLRELSPGQRCSAILPILLLSGEYPLVIDQPEENLDNRLIRQVIVNILTSMKLRRQVIIATHNPNLPVLGDVEQCLVLRAKGRDLSTIVAAGDLDSPSIVRHITEIMEGGREAFQYRQTIYQAHWTGPIDEEPTA
jgi:AAA domain, putative AbiEii toxin, Type IV TA system